MSAAAAELIPDAPPHGPAVAPARVAATPAAPAAVTTTVTRNRIPNPAAIPRPLTTARSPLTRSPLTRSPLPARRRQGRRREGRRWGQQVHPARAAPGPIASVTATASVAAAAGVEDVEGFAKAG